MYLIALEYLIRVFILTFVYLFSITIAGYMRAWVALRMGDETPALSGFLTWDPLRHADPIGFIVILFLNVGWAKSSVLDISLLKKKFGNSGVFVAVFFDVIVYFFLTVLSLFALRILFGPSILSFYILGSVFESASIPTMLSQFYPTAASWKITVGALLDVAVFLTMFIGGISFVSRLLELIFSYNIGNIAGVVRTTRYGMYSMIILITFIVFLIFQSYVAYWFLGSAYIVHGLAYLMGI